jgi:hypothetical protein
VTLREYLLTFQSVIMSSPSGLSIPENNYYSFFFLDCLILKVKTLWSFRTVRTTHAITRHQSAEDLKFQQCCCEHLRCFTFINMCTQKGSFRIMSTSCYMSVVLVCSFGWNVISFRGIFWHKKWLERVWWHLDDNLFNPLNAELNPICKSQLAELFCRVFKFSAWFSNKKEYFEN